MKAGIVSVVVLGGVLLLGGNTLACEVAGPNKHVGPVTAIDNEAATFTIMDAETRAPMTFAASGDVLRDVARAKGQVMVSYQDEDGKLVAVDVHF